MRYQTRSCAQVRLLFKECMYSTTLKPGVGGTLRAEVSLLLGFKRLRNRWRCLSVA